MPDDNKFPEELSDAMEAALAAVLSVCKDPAGVHVSVLVSFDDAPELATCASTRSLDEMVGVAKALATGLADGSIQRFDSDIDVIVPPSTTPSPKANRSRGMEA